MQRINKYKILDGDTVIFDGSSIEIAEKFGIKPKDLGTYAVNHTKLQGKYYVVRNGKVMAERTKKIVQTSKHKDNLEYLIKHLRKYGNTCFNGKIDDYIEELKEVGLEPKIRQVVSRNMSGRKEKWWVLEL
jgi:transposase